MLAACSGAGSHGGYGLESSNGRYKIGAPYEINGVWYYPAVDYDYQETGVASWYGEQFNHRYTANGEVFDLNDLTAAHRTLPLPSIVEVTNLDNGRVLRLRVNDRGPFARSRILDVSRRAAQLLGFENIGTAHVHVRILREESIQVAQAAMRPGRSGAVSAEALNTGAVGAYSPRPAPVMAAAAPVTAPPAPPESAPVAVAPMPPSRPAVPPSEPRQMAVAQAPPPRAGPPIEEEEEQPARAAPHPASGWARAGSLLIGSAEAAPMSPVRERPRSLSHSGRLFVQAGSFVVPENAQRVRARIAGLGSVEVLRGSVNGAAMYRVRLGPVATAAEADKLLLAVIGSGYPGARIVNN